ncbi:MAG: hypothetical protein ABI431_00305 [Candidatus Tumulicola sp.]
MRVAAVLAIVIAFCACAGRGHGPASDTTALHACETRQVELAGVDATVIANADASLAEVDLADGSSTGRQSALREAYKAFGKPHSDTIVHSIQSKWGLTTLVDRCGRAFAPHPASLDAH